MSRKQIIAGVITLLMVIIGVTILNCYEIANKKEKRSVGTSIDVEKTLKNTVIEGSLSSEEEDKVVNYTYQIAKVGVDTDYTKDDISTLKKFLNFCTSDVKNNITDESLAKIIEGIRYTKQVIEMKSINIMKVTKDSEGNITVDFTIKEKIVNHSNAELKGKTLDVPGRFIYNSNFEIKAFSFGSI